MKKYHHLLFITILISLILAGCNKAGDVSNKETNSLKNDQTTLNNDVVTEAPTDTPIDSEVSAEALYQDGSYEVQTPPDSELYYTKANLTIEAGKITAFDWTIYDSGHDNRPFDESYYEVFEGNDTYVQQAKDDWSGSREYSDVLIKTQDVKQVDAISGATWANRKFKEAAELVLEEAKTN